MTRLLAFLLTASTVSPAAAQPITGHTESLDSFVLNADFVLVGRVETIGEPDEQGVLPVIVVAAERLKGPHRVRRSVRLRTAPRTLRAWKTAEARLLIVGRSGDAAGAGAIDLSAEDLAVFRSDTSRLDDGDAVLRAARGVLRNRPGVTRVRTFTRMLPREAVAKTRYGGYAQTSLTVPVDERLEAWARRVLRDATSWERPEAARALRYFDTAENRALAKSLLADDTTAIRHRAAENAGREVKVFLVRRAAHETLDYWGVAHDEPAFTVERWLPGEVELAGLSNTKVSPADLRKLRRFPNLKMLFLWNSTFEGKVFDEIAALGSLEELYLDGTATTDAHLAQLAKLEKLRYVGLGGTRITSRGLASLAKIDSLKKITLERVEGVDAADVERLRNTRPDLVVER